MIVPAYKAGSLMKIFHDKVFQMPWQEPGMICENLKEPKADENSASGNHTWGV